MPSRRDRSWGAQLALDVAAAAEPRRLRATQPPLAAELSDADCRAIARHVVDLLRGEPDGRAGAVTLGLPNGARYAKAEQLMERYQVSMQFIRRHAAELGATRLSDAANSKLRYHLPTADAFIASHRKLEKPATGRGPAKTKARTHTPNGAPLVPFT